MCLIICIRVSPESKGRRKNKIMDVTFIVDRLLLGACILFDPACLKNKGRGNAFIADQIHFK